VGLLVAGSHIDPPVVLKRSIGRSVFAALFSFKIVVAEGEQLGKILLLPAPSKRALSKLLLSATRSINASVKCIDVSDASAFEVSDLRVQKLEMRAR